VSSRTETNLEGFVQSVTGRIQALSKANDFIIEVKNQAAMGLTADLQG
jgi:hypothetical protein